ncbi:hypothetical protein [Sediminicola luteus]|uniref:Glycosyl transferase family 1 domain-containing protein n=1 Tax=Sediminicola luteus TaxID=319238 RepID=A0ABV2TU39_9FLAO
MKARIVVIDLLAEAGHTKFVQETLKILDLKYDVLFVSSNSYLQKIKFSNSITLNDELFHYKNKYEFVNSQRRVIKKISNLNIIKRSDHILLTSFENISLSLFWRRKNKTFLYLHNNLDRGKLSSFLFNRINSNLSFFVFEEYIKNYLKKLSNECYHIPHPLSLIEHKPKSTSPKDFIFAPNLEFKSLSFKKALAFSQKSGLPLILKGEIMNRYGQNVISKPYFENYTDLIYNATYIILNIPYNYRISNIFYECMSFNKKIILLEGYGKFGAEMKKFYPYNIYVGDLNDVEFNNLNNSKFLHQHSVKNIIEKYETIFK